MRFTPIGPELLPRRIADELLVRQSSEDVLRVAFDAPDCAGIAALADRVAVALRASGRPVGVVDARTFYRDAALRYEYGKTDVESFYSGWLDAASLQREVLDRLSEDGSLRYLPALRDPDANRSSRAEPITLAPHGILIVFGELLLAAGLTFDVVVHALLTRLARRRLVQPDREWTLPAFDRYDLEVDPAARADLVLRYDDAEHPALYVR